MPSHHVTHLEKRLSHPDAQSLTLITPRNDTSVVVGKHHYRLAPQIRTEHPFARHKEIVAVHQPEHRALHPLYSFLMT